MLTDDGRLRVVYVTEDTERRRRPPRRLRAPQRPGRARPRRRAVDARRPARLVRAARARCAASPTTTSSSRRSRRSTRSRSRRGGRPPTPVWRASVLQRHPRLLRPGHRDHLLPRRTRSAATRCSNSYRPEFRYMTISGWNRERLRELGLDAELIPPGIDLEHVPPAARASRRDDMVLALGRSNPLKNLPLTLDAWRRLPEPRPELCLFGIEPELATRARHALRRLARRDEEVNELLNQATVFVQTSTHEGFCLPVAGGDGDRRRGRLHRRPRQPRLLRRRRELPDARGQRPRAVGGGDQPAARRPDAARAPRARRASHTRRRVRLGRRGSTRSSGSC